MGASGGGGQDIYGSPQKYVPVDSSYYKQPPPPLSFNSLHPKTQGSEFGDLGRARIGYHGNGNLYMKSQRNGPLGPGSYT